MKVKEKEVHYYEGEEKRREPSEIEKVYGTTIPYVFIRLVERLKELNACNIRGVFKIFIASSSNTVSSPTSCSEHVR